VISTVLAFGRAERPSAPIVKKIVILGIMVVQINGQGFENNSLKTSFNIEKSLLLKVILL